MPRNRQLTTARILAAAIRILQEEGFESWGVNRIAREAGVDKVLIYRYFESLEGLLESVIQETRFWPEPESLPDRSAEAFIDATLSAMAEQRQIPPLLGHPLARRPGSPINRKFSTDLLTWLEGIRERTTGRIPDSHLERLPALIHYQATTGQQNLSPHEIWLQVSPPLEWGRTLQAEDHGELPTELL